MNIIVSAKQMKNAERYMMAEVGMPSVVLMEKAADRIFEAVSIIADDIEGYNGRVLVLCGPGNNGGDGLAVARILKQHGHDVSVCIVGDEDRMTPECLLQKQMYENLGGVFEVMPDFDADIVIDAMLGIGISRNVEDDYATTIDELNDYHENEGVTVISVDIPSGLNADTGTVMGRCVTADYTVCLGYIKSGLYLNNGPDCCGVVMCNDIGIETPKDFCAVEFDEEDIMTFLPKRKESSNKSTYGKLMIIAGSDGMQGAAVLSTRAAFNSGIGMVKLLTDKAIIPHMLDILPEAMVDTYYSETVVRTTFDWADVVLIGPGLGRDAVAEDLFVFVMEKCKKPIVVDADGLYHLSNHMDILEKRRDMITILTPHPGEFARLFDITVADKKHQDLDFLKTMSKEYGVTIVAKDHHTIITGERYSVINTTGTNALATAGTGDVLAGIVSTMLVNTGEALDAGSIGCAIHGLAGQIASSKLNDYSVTASDVVNAIPEVMTILSEE